MIYLVWDHHALRLDADKIEVNVFITFIDYLLLAGASPSNLLFAKEEARIYSKVFNWEISWEKLDYIEDFNSIFYNENNNANYIRCERTGSCSCCILE